IVHSFVRCLISSYNEEIELTYWLVRSVFKDQKFVCVVFATNINISWPRNDVNNLFKKSFS
ncbi:hypothetical protein, partial [Thalassobacillus pellis]|uniref:hypothetical protein n=1 Tax=Thalassobacillus pellis TaxID=748008 RepID=UPI001962203D